MLFYVKCRIKLSGVIKSNATVTNYFIIFLSNVDMANFLLVFI